MDAVLVPTAAAARLPWRHTDLTIVTPGAADAATARAAFLTMDLPASGELPSMAAAIEAATDLEWVHVGWAGLDHPWFAGLAARGVTLTSSAGAGAVAVAHHAIAGLLAVRRGLIAAARSRAWRQADTPDVDGSRVVVLGMGPIGHEIGRLLVALGADAVGVRRAPRGDEPVPVVGLDELDRVVAGSDALVVALPSTPATRGMVGAGQLALLAPGATLVNVGRGDIVDERALVDAIITGHVGGAALDVFTVEPLPPDSRLWTLPTVLVTPHIAGRTPGTARRADQQFLANVARWRAAAPLDGVVPADRLWS